MNVMFDTATVITGPLACSVAVMKAAASMSDMIQPAEHVAEWIRISRHRQRARRKLASRFDTCIGLLAGILHSALHRKPMTAGWDGRSLGPRPDGHILPLCCTAA